MQKFIAKKILKKVKIDYKKISHEFDVTRQYQWNEFEEYKKYIKDGDSLADLGCGNGRFYSYIKDLKDIHYIGIDNSAALIQKAKEKFSKVKFLIGDMLDLPLEDKSQNVVVSIAALHHIPSKKLRERAISNIHRVLKKDGKLILSVWNLYQPKYIKYIRKARLKSIYTLGIYSPQDTFIPWGKTGIKRYYYAFRSDELEKSLKAEGFTLIKKIVENNIIFICKKKVTG